VLAALREVQIPLLALLLIGACLLKLSRVLRARSVDVALGPTALFPLNLRRPVAMAMCAVEMSLGILLLVTAGPFGRGMPATAVRAGTILLMVTAVGALVELRQRRPDVGCGCFGDLSSTPVSLRTITRSAVLAVAAAVTIGVPPVRLPPPGAALALRLTLLAVEFVLIAALSPEIGEALIRLGYSEPCELRVVPVQRTLAALHKSRAWHKHFPVLVSGQPVDVWRELCWRYLVYPGRYGGRDVEVVFAVYLRARRPAVRAAVVDAATDSVLPAIAVLAPPAPVADQRPPDDQPQFLAAATVADGPGAPDDFYNSLALSRTRAR
jgi:Methylamine utilisation protein MauE